MICIHLVTYIRRCNTVHFYILSGAVQWPLASWAGGWNPNYQQCGCVEGPCSLPPVQMKSSSWFSNMRFRSPNFPRPSDQAGKRLSNPS